MQRANALVIDWRGAGHEPTASEALFAHKRSGHAERHNLVISSTRFKRNAPFVNFFT